MTNYTTEWHTASTVSDRHQYLSCRQVYVWIVTGDNHVIIVSKDGNTWQLPGGKPEVSETYLQAAIREVSEETGLDISTQQDALQFIGYQVVTEPGEATSPYIQVRFALQLEAKADELVLYIGAEDANQSVEDSIALVKAVSPTEIATYIPWLPGSAEYAAFQQTTSR